MNGKSRFAIDVAVLLIGIGLGYVLYHPSPSKSEPPAPAVRQADGSLILERKSATLDEVKPKQSIPAGAKVERIVQVTVEPNQRAAVTGPLLGVASSTDTATPQGGALSRQDSPGAYPPVRVDLSLLRMKDDTRRVVASSPDGTVVGGLDVPIESPVSVRSMRWNAQGLVGYDSFRARRVYGGSVTYQRGLISGSAGVIGSTAFLGVGIRF